MKNILVVKLSALGDVICALPVAYALKETYPECHITWVVEPPAYDLVAMNDSVDEIIVFHKKDFKSIGGFLKNYGPLKRKIQARKYDAVLDLQGLFKSAAIARLGEAPVKLGVHYMRELSDRVCKPVVGPNVNGHIVERYLDVARALGCRVEDVRINLTVPERDQSLARQLFTRAGGNMDNPYIVLAIGSNWPNKRWPIKHFARLVDMIYDAGVIPVVVGGGAVDMGLLAELNAAVEIPPLSLVGQTNFRELTYILQQARAVVGGDTGVTHLAAGLGTRTIEFAGPTNPVRSGPYGQPDNAIVADRPCRFCYKRACPKGLDCLDVITAEQIREKLFNV